MCVSDMAQPGAPLVLGIGLGMRLVQLGGEMLADDAAGSVLGYPASVEQDRDRTTISALAKSFFGLAFSRSSSFSRFASRLSCPAVVPPALPGRLGDAEVAQQRREVPTLVEQPFTLTNLAGPPYSTRDLGGSGSSHKALGVVP